MNHSRKIKYTKDIAPVASDFKKYKDLKSDIQRLEAMIQSVNIGTGSRGQIWVTGKIISMSENET